ncbi:Integrin alpha-8 [Apodemus speciosus]|uniref:Integrin alpha-8 n=1 Tax=Apodemus speciosus TaxID=105296 RepID=A0ABQ0EFX3_APOSI
MENVTRMVVCDLGNPMVTGTNDEAAVRTVRSWICLTGTEIPAPSFMCSVAGAGTSVAPILS